ncbi:hypothetical protein TB2_014288 [Malus domestica]
MIHDVIRYIQVFENHDASAGASMSHSHSQIMTLPSRVALSPSSLSLSRRTTQNSVCDKRLHAQSTQIERWREVLRGLGRRRPEAETASAPEPACLEMPAVRFSTPSSATTTTTTSPVTLAFSSSSPNAASPAAESQSTISSQVPERERSRLSRWLLFLPGAITFGLGTWQIIRGQEKIQISPRGDLQIQANLQIQTNLLLLSSHVSISPSPTSSSPVASPASSTYSKQSLMEAATAISEGKSEAAAEILARMITTQVPDPRPNSEQRLLEFLGLALKSRVGPIDKFAAGKRAFWAGA